MLSLEEKATIFRLLDAGLPIAEIVRRTGRSTGTIYSIKNAQKGEIKKSLASPTPLKIEPFTEFIDLQLKNGAVNKHKLYQAAKEQGYEGSYGSLSNYVGDRISKSRFYRQSQKVETTPGEQAQVDWGSFGRITIGDRIERVYAFVYVLSYSRAMYVEFVIRQNQQTFQACHMHAFAKLGIPRNIRYDNVKTVVLSRKRPLNDHSKDRSNPAFIDFARYYSFNIELCPPYWPRSKGKVESAIKYLRHNFMEQQKFGKTFKNLDELNSQVQEWVEEVAQQRIHRATEEKPYDSWQKEKRYLQFPNLPLYVTTPLLPRRSTKDGLVQYKANLYAVPMAFAQKKVMVRETNHYGQAYLEIYYKNDIVTRHKISLDRGKWIIDGEDFYQPQTTKSSPLSVKEVKKRPKLTVVPRGLGHYNNFIPRRQDG